VQFQDYPALYKAADAASTQAQKIYMRLVAIDLILTAAGALITIYNYECPSTKGWIYIVSGLLIGITFLLTIVLKSRKFDKIWYKGRALAESAKTLTWRFITCSQNFEIAIPEASARQIFLDRLKELSDDYDGISEFLDTQILSGTSISDVMLENRKKSTNERKALYLNERIIDQKNWYANKAKQNKKKKNFFFYAILVAQFVTVLASAILFKYPTSSWNVVGLLTTISAALLAWLQLKQHESLSQAYTTAVIELNYIEDKCIAVTTDDELSKFVLDSENAISREHTLWLAQKR
jgi:hypothetical protein